MPTKNESVYRIVQKITIGMIMLIVLLGTIFNNVSAQNGNPPTDDQINEIAKELYCPVCENIPLDVCPTQACAQWRGMIREKLVAGWTKEEIKAFFVAQFGDRVLAEPPRRGLNWLVYVLPPVIFLIGVGILYLNLKRLRRNPSPAPGETQHEMTEEDRYLSEFESTFRSMQDSDKKQ